MAVYGRVRFRVLRDVYRRVCFEAWALVPLEFATECHCRVLLADASGSVWFRACMLVPLLCYGAAHFSCYLGSMLAQLLYLYFSI